MKKEKFGEALRFVITGGVSFLVEFALLVFFRDVCHLSTLIANGIAFLVAVVVNYLLCFVWVFQGARGGGRAQAGFLLTSLVGLVLNELLMFLFGKLWGEDGVILTLLSFRVTMYMFSKCLATLIVMIWTYFSKRYVLKRGT